MAKKETLNVESLLHVDDKRINIPFAEYQTMIPADMALPIHVSFAKRNPDLDPQLIWRGKYEGDETLTIPAPPIYIQEQIHPKALVKHLMEQSRQNSQAQSEQLSLFSDFNGMPANADKTDFYKHDHNWTNRMILGDSLQVMASLSEREGLRGKVQCIYIDPPYGIKFNSNFQWSTTSRDVKDGKADNFTREPEQVKAFRDTWKDGIHSYLSYLRDRFLIARDLLTDSGSIFVQIGDENVHRVRTVMDEVFGEDNFISQLTFKKTTGRGSDLIDNLSDYILWYAKRKDIIKFNRLLLQKNEEIGSDSYRLVELPSLERRPLTEFDDLNSVRLFRGSPLTSEGASKNSNSEEFIYQNQKYTPGKGHFKTDLNGLNRLNLANRLYPRKTSLEYVRYFNDFPAIPLGSLWMDTQSGSGMDKIYIVQTNTKVISRCLLMATDPGDLVLDPTCGSGTTAFVAEQWGRRWITIDTSRVALALARSRLMGAKYPYYIMADSKEGQLKEAELSQRTPSSSPTYGNIKMGFVYERVPHITLKAIANNTAIDTIWEKWQRRLEPLREKINAVLGTAWEEWQIPREPDSAWKKSVLKLHEDWWKARIARQQEIDASIAANADYEYLYDKPYEDKSKVRVAGPFTVESVSPHRCLGVGADGELLDPQSDAPGADSRNFVTMILDNLKAAGVQQSHKEDKIEFLSLQPWPGQYICAEGIYQEGEKQKRTAVFIGPEFGTVSRADIVQAAREASEAGFDILISCAFNYDAASTELTKLGRIPILKARMNADLHMGEELKNTGKGNLFVVFGEPDITILQDTDGKGQENGKIRVQINGVDVFYPNSGEIRADNADGIACWFIDTEYNSEQFFIRHAYFLGANDPYKSLQTTLKAEINREAWESLHSAVSRPFAKPKNGLIAVKVINHLGDEVMKVIRV